MISQIKNFYDFFIMFPNVISVSSESKISLITLVTIFLFVTFDRGRTYSFLLTFFTSSTKLNRILYKIRTTCEYLFKFLSCMNLILWILLVIIEITIPTSLSENQKRMVNDNIQLLHNFICFILNVTLYTIFVDFTVYNLWSNFQFKSINLINRIFIKYSYYYRHLNISLSGILLSITTYIFFTVIIDLNFFSLILGNMVFSTSYFNIFILLTFGALLGITYIKNNSSLKEIFSKIFSNFKNTK